MQNLPEGVQRAHDKYAAVQAERQAIADEATAATPVTATGKSYRQSIKDQDEANARLAVSRSAFDALPTVVEAQADLLAPPTAAPVPTQAAAIETGPVDVAAETAAARELSLQNRPATTRRERVMDMIAQEEARPQNLGRYDTSDIDARLEAIKGSRYGASLQDFKDAEGMRNKRLELAQRGQEQNLDYDIAGRNADRQERATASLIRSADATMARNDVPDSVKQKLSMWRSVIEDPMVLRQYTEAGINPFAKLGTIMQEMNSTEINRQRGFAEGGEVSMLAPEIPSAIDEAPVDMDSGDYVIPVEAMRFYGRKFFQDLIAKAEDTE